MIRYRTLRPLFAIVFAVFSAARADAQTPQPATPAAVAPVVCRPEFLNGGRTILVNWQNATACLAQANSKWDGRASSRIDEDMSVTIRSTHFNFIKYTIKYQVDETIVESYVLLAQLWQSLLGLSLTPEFRTELAGIRTASGNALLEWATALISAQTKLEVAAQAAPARAYLSLAEVNGVKASVVSLGVARADVMQRYAALSQLTSFPEFEQYTKIKAFHDAVLTRLDAYLDLASLTADGQAKTIPKKKGGTIVTVTMTPAAIAGAERTPVLTVQYFSHSRLPLTFHAGYTLARLQDVDFEKVAAFGGSDMFTRIKTNKDTETFTAFMTYEPRTWLEEKAGAGISIGTDIVKPGQRLFVGGSVRYGRFVFTLGGMSGELKDGVDPVIEDLGDGNTRQLYGAIATKRDWGRFYAVSVKVF